MVSDTSVNSEDAHSEDNKIHDVVRCMKIISNNVKNR